MLHFFRAGPDRVRWELSVVEEAGPYRLSLQHASGVIVEYFETSAAALVRVHELEELLVRARGSMKSELTQPSQRIHGTDDSHHR